MIRRPPRSTLFPYNDALPICAAVTLELGKQPPIRTVESGVHGHGDRKSTRLNSSHVSISYAVFCLKKKTSTSAMTPPTRTVTSAIHSSVIFCEFQFYRTRTAL